MVTQILDGIVFVIMDCFVGRDGCEYFFLGAFGCELAFKLWAFGWMFFTDGSVPILCAHMCNPDLVVLCSWNIFDFVVVATSVLDMTLAGAGVGNSQGGFSVLRVLRIFRIVRVIGFVERLNMLVMAFLTAVKSVMWVGILLLMALYIFAILSNGLFKDYSNNFRTVTTSMLALFEITTGDSWSKRYLFPIGDQTLFAYFFFCVYMLVIGFGLLNLLMGVFIECLFEVTKKNDVIAKKAKEKHRRQLIKIVAGAFKQTDEDGGGTLDEDELPKMLALCEEYQDMLEFVGLDYTKMQRACLIADYDHTGRSYWQGVDEDGEETVYVHSKVHRPVPSKKEREAKQYKRMARGDEGVMEGEIVECLTNMDNEMTRADFYAMAKR